MAPIAASSSSETAGEGPVLSLINKRLRALRKKLNRISQMEDSLSRGKLLNKEQEEALRSKPFVMAGIDELEKLRAPLMQAVNQEIQIALVTNKQASETRSEDRTTEEEILERVDTGESSDVVSAVADLLNVIYVGTIFDVSSPLMSHDSMLMRTHERNCCLTYDYVTDDDDAGDVLREWDLDSIAMMGGLLISRPVHSSLSHKDSLQNCVERAKLWLANSDQPIEPDSNTTYVGLKQKLHKIMASDYFTTIPEIKAPVEVAAAVGNYTPFQVPLHDSLFSHSGFTHPMEGSTAEFEQEVMRQGRWF